MAEGKMTIVLLEGKITSRVHPGLDLRQILFNILINNLDIKS